MCRCNEYAELLRIGERKRDASDKIRGFLYQDLIAINLILAAADDDEVFVEWIEDIFVENATTISIFQVKHYPETPLQFKEIYENMFFQFLKFKLYETDKKEVTACCIYHANEYKDIDETEKNSCVTKENDIRMIDKANIIQRLEICDNMPKRKELLFSEVSCTELLNEFNFQKQEKGDVANTRNLLKTELYKAIVTDEDMLKMKNKEDVEDMLLAVAIQYIQVSYYKKSENYNERCMTKALFFEYMSNVIGEDEQKYTERIKFIVMGYIDEVFSEILNEIIDDGNADIYKEIYFLTKDFFMSNLETKDQRFKFLNTISTENYEKLNREKYMQNIKSEIDRFLEHKDKINLFIKTIWKILYDIDSKDISLYIKEGSDCFLFEFPAERAKPVIILAPGNGQPNREASKTLDRISNMKLKPRKWYFEGKLKGIYEYSYNINKISEAKINGDFSVLCNEHDCFKIECMDCIKLDENEMETKDNPNDCIFKFECIKGD